jgi:hypothetical protein
MGVDTLNKQLGALREGDEAVAGMLSELDARLSEWLSAMRAGQATVLAGLARVDGPRVEPASTEETASEPALAAPTETSLESGNDVPGPPDAPPPAQSEPRTQRPKGMFETPVPIGPAEPLAEPELPAEPARDGPSSLEEDEALLAQLDEKTASLIRVKRRLSNNSRSVQELLEEIRAEQKPTKPRTKQRSQWWRRTHEQQGG